MPITTPAEGDAIDVSRRTWLAAERMWLAWWRTGLATGALAIAVGRLIPSLTGGARWPFRLLGLGYGALAVIVLIVGVVRQARMAKALRRWRQREGRAMRDRYIVGARSTRPSPRWCGFWWWCSQQ